MFEHSGWAEANGWSRRAVVFVWLAFVAGLAAWALGDARAARPVAGAAITAYAVGTGVGVVGLWHAAGTRREFLFGAVPVVVAPPLGIAENAVGWIDFAVGGVSLVGLVAVAVAVVVHVRRLETVSRGSDAHEPHG